MSPTPGRVPAEPRLRSLRCPRARRVSGLEHVGVQELPSPELTALETGELCEVAHRIPFRAHRRVEAINDFLCVAAIEQV